MAGNNLSKKQEELARRLKDAGVHTHVALTLAYLTAEDEATRQEIQEATGLKQPEVSIATQKMREIGWMSTRDIKREGKGRPAYSYSLVLPMDEIIKEIESNEMAKVRQKEINLKKLRNLVDDLY